MQVEKADSIDVSETETQRLEMWESEGRNTEQRASLKTTMREGEDGWNACGDEPECFQLG